MSRSDTKLKIPSNINQNQFINFVKLKMGNLKFNKNGIVIIHKHEFLQDIIPIFFLVSKVLKNIIFLKKNLSYLNYHLYCLKQ